MNLFQDEAVKMEASKTCSTRSTATIRTPSATR